MIRILLTDKPDLRVKSIEELIRIISKEIVQLYVRDVESKVNRPEKELKGFEKVELAPGEEKTVTFKLDKRSFAYYNTEIRDWYVESGEFEILVGKSSKEIELKETVKVNSTVTIKKKYDRNSLVRDLLEDPKAEKMIIDLVDSILEKIKEPGKEKEDVNNVIKWIMDMPLRGLVSFSKGTFNDEMLQKFLEVLNK